MHQAHLALKLTSVILQQSAGSASSVSSVILPQCLTLLTSSLLQGLALESLLQLFAAMVASKGFSFDSLIDSLVAVVAKRTDKDGELSRSSYACIAQCVATLTSGAAVRFFYLFL